MYLCFQALKARNKLRKKVGKNKIVPQAQTDLAIETERVLSPRKESPTSWEIFTVEKKEGEIVTECKEQTDQSNGDHSVGADVNIGSLEKSRLVDNAGGDAALQDFAVNYINTLVIPKAVDRYLAEERDKDNVSVSSTGGGSDISAAVSDFVRTSLTNAKDLLKQEQVVNSSERNLGEIINCKKSYTTEAFDAQGDI